MEFGTASKAKIVKEVSYTNSSEVPKALELPTSNVCVVNAYNFSEEHKSPPFLTPQKSFF